MFLEGQWSLETCSAWVQLACEAERRGPANGMESRVLGHSQAPAQRSPCLLPWVSVLLLPL